jgi:mRNA-degrading endonuclease RelE of RelBE toxin-antitoxin system
MSDLFSLNYSSDFKLRLNKICKSDRKACHQIEEKIVLIQENPKSGIYMKKLLQGMRRIHAGHYVIAYATDYEKRDVTLVNIDHHDFTYIKK